MIDARVWIGFGAAVLAVTLIGVALAQEPSSKPPRKTVARSAPLWRGVHVSLNRSPAAKKLLEEIPQLAAIGVNVLVVEVDYGFAYTSHPELRNNDPVTAEEAGRLSAACRAHSIRLIPQFQCLGHQSWKGHTGALLAKHPEFDETPGQYPENKGIYCRSWCPLNPDVNNVVFDLFDELIDAFHADALHVGMDEVFLIGSEHCPRCKGKDPAELFAKAVNDYHEHLVGKRKVEMLMWGDRLIDAKALGLSSKWDASMNGTAGAIDMIPKDIIICDWHYQKRDAYPSVPMFIEKGFRVLPSGWQPAENVEALAAFAREQKSPLMLGLLCTTWGRARPGDLHTWPPILTGMKAMGAAMQGEKVPPADKE